MKTKFVIILDNWLHFLFKPFPKNFEKICDLRDALENQLDVKDLQYMRRRNQ